MKIWTEPKVTLIGRWEFLGHPDYEVPQDGDNITRGLAFAAKGCYKSFGKDGRPCADNQRAILAHRHGSVLEHATFTFYVEGVSRALTLEMNRHRHLAISQESTRYVNEENSGIVLDPYFAHLYNKKRTLDEELLLTDHIRASIAGIDAYTRQVKRLESMNPLGLEGFDLRKWARGKARNVLPHNLESKITYSGNIRAWRHFLETRSDPHAEPEIRRLCSHIFAELENVAPLYFEDYELDMYPQNPPPGYPRYPFFTTNHRKV